MIPRKISAVPFLPLIWNKNEEYKARADDIDPTQRLGIAQSWRENFLI